MNAIRRGDLTAFSAPKPRGSSDSNSGRATTVPMPRNTVRRERSRVVISLLRRGSLLERVALDDLDEQGGELVVRFAGGGHDGVHRPTVVVFQPAAERVGEHLLGHALDERG